MPFFSEKKPFLRLLKVFLRMKNELSFCASTIYKKRSKLAYFRRRNPRFRIIRFSLRFLKSMHTKNGRETINVYSRPMHNSFELKAYPSEHPLRGRTSFTRGSDALVLLPLSSALFVYPLRQAYCPRWANESAQMTSHALGAHNVRLTD